MTTGMFRSSPLIMTGTMKMQLDETVTASTTTTVLTLRFASKRVWFPAPPFVPSVSPAVLSLCCCWSFWFCSDVSIAWRRALPNMMNVTIVISAMRRPLLWVAVHRKPRGGDITRESVELSNPQTYGRHCKAHAQSLPSSCPCIWVLNTTKNEYPDQGLPSRTSHSQSPMRPAPAGKRPGFLHLPPKTSERAAISVKSANARPAATIGTIAAPPHDTMLPNGRSSQCEIANARGLSLSSRGSFLSQLVRRSAMIGGAMKTLCQQEGCD